MAMVQTALGQATIRLGIDTLIADILVCYCSFASTQQSEQTPFLSIFLFYPHSPFFPTVSLRVRVVSAISLTARVDVAKSYCLISYRLCQQEVPICAVYVVAL